MYGHLTDPSRRIDVALALQRRVDNASGERLCIGINESLSELFGGDPCPSLRKALFLTVEVAGREFTNQYGEQHDLLVDPVRLLAAEWQGALEINEAATTIRVLAATIGEVGSPSTAIDVTKLVQRRADDGGGKVLMFDRTENLGYILPDPAPGSDKIMIIRYSVWNRVGELRAELFPIDEGFKMKRPLTVEVADEKPRFTLHAATFGHPSLPTLRFDCTERLQGRIDELGAGEFFSFLADMDLCEWLGGDPYPYVLAPSLRVPSQARLACHVVVQLHLTRAPVVCVCL